MLPFVSFLDLPVLGLIGTPTQMIILMVVILLLFGSRLPGLMRSLGSSVTEFKKGIKNGDDENDGSPKT
ncbi:twin arginine translocase protein A [Caulifigura coniformis]|uniref:Twin arginine translocase protein A n=1 Tax=Caulifigura coniformis TaxID=2527983 RepID=A0A517SBD5_9PLAN|nr:twin-arginine translocase TatA/TatE family subunit [Caulifigura coniformis]QDT53428.1 twin arginine translocase protein A [Caulifigura coniformis]